ncbi:MAG: LemA family protein [Solirubrobacterales bacterium]|nr:LemA family protein [Solirubrobacterales bacterium]
MTAVIVVVVVAVVLAIWFFSTYNRLVSLRVAGDEGASEIDVQLKRRHDLIPNLVESVKGYAAHERGTFDEVTAARASAVNAQGPAAQGQAEGALTQALGKLFAVAEAYPDLKANQNFLQLQGELTATEDRLSAARRFYNTTVKALNTACQTIPSKWVAPMAKVTEREFFELENPAESAVPSVSFS